MLTKLSKPSAVLLIDLKNAYAQIHELFEPELIGATCGVLSANDGNFISRNDELKELGVPMGAPFFQYKNLLEKSETKIRSSNFELYLDMSQRFYDTIQTFTPDAERYSIDEIFFELSESKKSFDYVGKEVLEKVYKWLGLITRIGIGSNKTLSKIANNIAKKSVRAQGLVNLYNSPHVNVALERTKIGDVWGIGSRYAEELIKRNINNALQFKFYSRREVRQLMTVVGARTHLEINGIRVFDLELTPPIRKTVGVSRSFGEPILSFNEVYQAVSNYLFTAVNKMRGEGLAAKRLTVYISSSSYQDNYYARGFTYKSAYPSNNLFELQEWTRAILIKIFKPGVDYRRAGVELSQLIPREGVTKRLYPELRTNPKHELLNKIIDEVNRKHGSGTLRLAVAGQGNWKQKAAFLSPRYTTRIDEVIRLK